MKSFFEWWATSGISPDRPWLVLGKGPSFGKRHDVDLSRFMTLGLNHVCREQRVHVAHAIDLDVVDDCADVIDAQCDVLVMPWVPHTKNEGAIPLLQHPTKLSSRHLGQLSEEHPVLKRLNAEGRLLYYNLSTNPSPHGGTPVIGVRYFSAEAALNLLATAGARHVRSLGIDGGTSYSQDFSDLRDKTLLANRRASFDRQFQEIARTIMTTGLDYAPLDIESPVRVYVATQDAQMLSVKVLEYSLRKHASLTVEVFPMHLGGISVPMPKDDRNKPRTPFSFQRFLIPELAGHKGRAIYLDSDMQVFRDIREVWTLPFQGASLLAAREPGATGRKPQFSVMLLDCAALAWRIEDIVAQLDRGELSYEDLLYQMKVAPSIRADIDPSWNSLERYEEGVTGLLHYTDMGTQPWVHARHPFGYLWVRDLLEAIDAGAISRALVEEHVLKGYVRPSLLHQVDARLEDGLLLPKSVSDKDAAFRAPFESIHRHGGSAWTNPTVKVKAVARHLYYRSPLAAIERRVRQRFAR